LAESVRYFNKPYIRKRWQALPSIQISAKMLGADYSALEIM
jgi:hypothetical protein